LRTAWPRLALPWPAPALLVWAGAWLAWWAQRQLGASAGLAWAGALACGAALALLWPGLSRWRRGLMALGFPASALAAGHAQGLPAWAWLLPLALLLLAYPIKAWRDAPLFPTPASALTGLAQAVPLPAGASVLDAGCGLGHGLRALRGQWPDARLHGVEWSWPLAWAARLRCPRAQVRRGDMWRCAWQPHAVVYLFQRPESMARAWAKACADMAPGSWLVSLDFAVPGVSPSAVLRQPGAQPLWLYQLPPAQSGSAPADNHRKWPAAVGRP
jgi:hypothetical protein